MPEPYYKSALAEFKKRKGPASQELRDHNRKTSAMIKAVRKSLESGKQTVPEIAEDTEYKTHEVFFAINALRKYEGLLIINKREDYPQYAFEEKSS